jgi:hypothetical protein
VVAVYDPPALQYLILPENLPMAFQVPEPGHQYEGEVELEKFVEGSGYHEQFPIPKDGLRAVAGRVMVVKQADEVLELRQHIGVFGTVENAEDAFLALPLAWPQPFQNPRPLNPDEMPNSLGDESFARCGTTFFGEKCLVAIRIGNLLVSIELDASGALPSPVTRAVLTSALSQIRDVSRNK